MLVQESLRIESDSIGGDQGSQRRIELINLCKKGRNTECREVVFNLLSKLILFHQPLDDPVIFSIDLFFCMRKGQNVAQLNLICMCKYSIRSRSNISAKRLIFCVLWSKFPQVYFRLVLKVPAHNKKCLKR